MKQQIYPIETGYFQLDGGAMFGVVPKSMWQKLNPPDENNLCTWAMRCLLLVIGDQKILIDTGMGTKQDPKFRSHFQPHGEDDLITNLNKIGVPPEEITDVILTHLHFDHCGGAVSKDEDQKLIPTFKNARYYSNQKHWSWAIEPNDREKASFLKENFIPLAENGKINWIQEEGSCPSLPKEIQIKFCYGHTEAMMICKISINQKTYIYCADLLPSSAHISMPFIMAYDVRPLQSLKEKEMLLNDAVNEKHILILEHDPKYVACTVKYNEAGRIVLDECFSELTQYE